MPLQTKQESSAELEESLASNIINERIFTKDYVEFLNDAGWILEKKLPSNTNHYSDLLEDTDWNYTNRDIKSTKHYRRDLDALS